MRLTNTLLVFIFSWDLITIRKLAASYFNISDHREGHRQQKVVLTFLPLYRWLVWTSASETEMPTTSDRQRKKGTDKHHSTARALETVRDSN